MNPPNVPKIIPTNIDILSTNGSNNSSPNLEIILKSQVVNASINPIIVESIYGNIIPIPNPIKTPLSLPILVFLRLSIIS